MSEPREVVMTEVERRARDAVHALPAAGPDPAWRARTGEAFARGTLAEGAFTALPASTDPIDAADPSRPRVVTLPRRAPSALPWLVGAAAAALIAVAWFGRAPQWQVVAATPAGRITIGGEPFPLTDANGIGRRLAHGGTVRMDGGRLWVRAAGTMAVEITPGTVATLPPAPMRWFARHMEAHVQTGELRITTGPRFHGARLAVTTPEARVEVTGTTLAVICEPTGTCVCVYEGRVMVGPMHGDMQAVTGGDRRYVFTDGRAPEHATMRDTERPELARLRAAQGPELDAGR